MIHQSGLLAGEAERTLPCDDLLPNADIVIDRATTVPAPPATLWPWLLQIGKDRAGWYLPRSIERLLPRRNRAAATLSSYPDLAIGDTVDDWGPGNPKLVVAVLDPEQTLGFASTRGRAELTWVLHLEPVGETASRLHLRLRIDRPRDWLTPVITYGGGVFDYLTIIGLFAGLKERLATHSRG